MKKENIPTILGRLLREVSWEGNARHYRDGGQGRENVLTAEVLQVLDDLPRQYFLGPVTRSMHGAHASRRQLVKEIEEAGVEMLPANILLRQSAKSWQEQCIVQPDGLIQSPSTYCLVEAKRMGRSCFQPKQLAREFVGVVREAGHRVPILILITGVPPPLPVARYGKRSIQDAIDLKLDFVVEREAENLDKTSDELRRMVRNHVCWITWEEIGKVVLRQKESFRNRSDSVERAVSRLVERLAQTVKWHSKGRL